jgi:hypothetical protein
LVVHLAGKAGYALEAKTDTQTAVVLIYLKSDPDIVKYRIFTPMLRMSWRIWSD